MRTKRLGKHLLIRGDSLSVLPLLRANSVDSIVTDPPYGLSVQTPENVIACLRAWLAGEAYTPRKRGFMGKRWDAWVPGPEIWRECYRVLKPGGHVLAFAGTRTVDLMGIALRLAGFEVRDLVAWMYGQGFPKSLNIGKMIDKMKGKKRKDLGVSPNWRESKRNREHLGKFEVRGKNAGRITAPATPEAAQWEGYGTALKPALEPILLCRKPFDGKSITRNVMVYGTGGLNIGGCRIAHNEPIRTLKAQKTGHDFYKQAGRYKDVTELKPEGRWPANVVLDPEAASELDRQSGFSKTKRIEKPSDCGGNTWGGTIQTNRGARGHTDEGGASRFFYCAKANRKEREAGLVGVVEPIAGYQATGRKEGTAGLKSPRAGAGRTAALVRNSVPTVKPVALIRWLIRLVTPSGGTCLDPYMGSGTTGIACVKEGFRFLGVERMKRSFRIAVARVRHYRRKAKEV